MSTEVKSHARAVLIVAVFALALLLSPCSTFQQANTQNSRMPAQSQSADQQSARRVADSRFWIRVRGRERTAVFTEDGVLKKELSRMPPWSELSPDGSRLLEVRFANGASDLFVSDADGSHARKIARGVSFQDEAHWSHDGKRVLYARGFHVLEADARGAVLRKFARGDEVVTEPLYTPDGRVSYILKHFPKGPRPPHSDNFVVIKKRLPADIVVTDGATESVVVEDRPIRTYAWDSSGQRLAFSTYDDGGHIVTRDLADGTERVVKLSDIDERLGGFVAHDIRWRPDGGAVAFTLSFTGGSEKGDKTKYFGDDQLFVLYPDGRATWFDVGETYSIFDWIPTDNLPE
jgi:hypothetical protein